MVSDLLRPGGTPWPQWASTLLVVRCARCMDWSVLKVARLNYRHLEYFWHVAREGGVTAASRVLHVSQPAISASGEPRERVEWSSVMQIRTWAWFVRKVHPGPRGSPLVLTLADLSVSATSATPPTLTRTQQI